MGKAAPIRSEMHLKARSTMGFELRTKIVANSNASMSRQTDMPVGGVFKRSFDIVFSLVALISLLPVFLIIAAMLRVYDKGPTFFIHERVGFDGRRFGCIKFRTMVVDADTRLKELLENDPAARKEFERDRKLKNDPRIVPTIGTFLRGWSLDELPQLINVLLGHMSVVGPRPVTAEEYERYGAVKKEYRSVRPGITGLWQISGRNDMSFEDRVAIDKSYVQRWAMSRDIWIIWRTFDVVYRQQGAY